MTPQAFLALCDEIASQLDGTRVLETGTADGAPSGSDIAWINLANEREGLRVILRRGYGVEYSRVRASMGVTAEMRAGHDYRALPAFHDLTTAAALSRGARVIAAQIESKIVQPALPMLAEWKVKREAEEAHARKLAAAIETFRTRYPAARVSDDGDFSLFSDANGYLRGRINSDGGLYVDRCSVGGEAAFALLDILARK
jgi:hypothetical protein